MPKRIIRVGPVKKYISIFANKNNTYFLCIKVCILIHINTLYVHICGTQFFKITLQHIYLLEKKKYYIYIILHRRFNKYFITVNKIISAFIRI